VWGGMGLNTLCPWCCVGRVARMRRRVLGYVAFEARRTVRVTVCALQFRTTGRFSENVERASRCLEDVGRVDFALIGGELSLNERRNANPYALLGDLARCHRCNVVAPVDANLQRFRAERGVGYYSMHVLDRCGEVVGVQDKHHFYWKEKPWYRRGSETRVFDVDGLKIGLVRGLDIVYPDYTEGLRAAELLFFSTMAVDDVMLRAAGRRSVENRCYVAMSSYLGDHAGMAFGGNAALIQPVGGAGTERGEAGEAVLLQHTRGEGSLCAELDLDYLHELRRSSEAREL